MFKHKQRRISIPQTTTQQPASSTIKIRYGSRDCEFFVLIFLFYKLFFIILFFLDADHEWRLEQDYELDDDLEDERWRSWQPNPDLDAFSTDEDDWKYDHDSEEYEAAEDPLFRD